MFKTKLVFFFSLLLSFCISSNVIFAANSSPIRIKKSKVITNNITLPDTVTLTTNNKEKELVKDYKPNKWLIYFSSPTGHELKGSAEFYVNNVKEDEASANIYQTTPIEIGIEYLLIENKLLNLGLGYRYQSRRDGYFQGYNMAYSMSNVYGKIYFSLFDFLDAGIELNYPFPWSDQKTTGSSITNDIGNAFFLRFKLWDGVVLEAGKRVQSFRINTAYTEFYYDYYTGRYYIYDVRINEKYECDEAYFLLGITF